MNKIDFDLMLWAEDQVNTMHRSGFHGMNIIYKILKDPGISTGGSRHRILWWPKSKRIARMSKAMHQVSQRGQLCLLVEYGKIVKLHDGQILEKAEFSRFMGFGCKCFDANVKISRNILIPLIN